MKNIGWLRLHATSRIALFFSSSQVPKKVCCAPLNVSSIGKRITKSFSLAGINKKIGTRIIRRVLETFMREEMKDPGWNMHLAMYYVLVL